MLLTTLLFYSPFYGGIPRAFDCGSKEEATVIMQDSCGVDWHMVAEPNSPIHAMYIVELQLDTLPLGLTDFILCSKFDTINLRNTSDYLILQFFKLNFVRKKIIVRSQVTVPNTTLQATSHTTYVTALRREKTVLV